MFLNSFFAFPAAAAQARTLKKQVFVWKVLHFSRVGRFRAEPKKQGLLLNTLPNNDLETHQKTDA